MTIRNLEPKLVWNWFADINAIPRKSYHEQQLAKYLVDWAKSKNFFVEQDQEGNVLIRKPSSKDYENKPTIALQAHLDMVCEANDNFKFDFLTQGIETYIDGDYVYANNTTLGADNGMGLSMILAVLDDEKLQHPELEAIFTVAEEVGMDGALNLKQNWLKSNYMINLDTAEWGKIYVGCAGSLGASLDLSFDFKEKLTGETLELKVCDFRGGHSGIEIHSKENAIVAGFSLLKLLEPHMHIHLNSFTAGSSTNAIPREIKIQFTVDSKEDKLKALDIFKKEKHLITDIYSSVEINAKYTLSEVEKITKVLSVADSKKLINFVLAVPNGVQRWSPSFNNTVESSLSLNIIKLTTEGFHINFLLRSILNSGNFNTFNKLNAVVQEFYDTNFVTSRAYPAWQPEVNDSFQNYIKKEFSEFVEKEVNLEVIHAGLECGIIVGRYPNMKVASFGPNIYYLHSPKEHVQISSVEKTYNLLTKVLKNIPNNLE